MLYYPINFFVILKSIFNDLVKSFLGPILTQFDHVVNYKFSRYFTAQFLFSAQMPLSNAPAIAECLNYY